MDSSTTPLGDGLTEMATKSLDVADELRTRLTRIYAALSASNEAIIRAKSSEELFQWVCDAAVHGSKFSNATVMLKDPGSEWMVTVASTGITASVTRGTLTSADELLPEGRGTVGTAYRSQKPCVTNDYLIDERLRPWHAVARVAGWNSAAVFPLIQHGVSVGVLGFNSSEKNAFDEEMISLLLRVAENVSFGLENFEREKKLRESEARFRSLTKLSSDWYWEQDKQYRLTRLEGQKISDEENAEPETYLGMTRWGAGFDIDGGWEAHLTILRQRASFRDVVMHRMLADGTRRYMSVSGEPLFEGTDFVGYRGVGRDVTLQKQSEERIQYLATHDGLTGLPNRRMFSDLLNQAILSAKRHDRPLTVMFIDLDKFKAINDTLGHAAGDQLLQVISSRLSSELRSCDVVARLGGDEFVIMVQEVTESDHVVQIAGKILGAMSRPVTLAGKQCQVSASIGVSTFPTDASDEQTLMKNADIAMYMAKERGKNNVQFYPGHKAC